VDATRRVTNVTDVWAVHSVLCNEQGVARYWVLIPKGLRKGDDMVQRLRDVLRAIFLPPRPQLIPLPVRTRGR
jgi:hypothetical protein